MLGQRVINSLACSEKAQPRLTPQGAVPRLVFLTVSVMKARRDNACMSSKKAAISDFVSFRNSFGPVGGFPWDTLLGLF